MRTTKKPPPRRPVVICSLALAALIGMPAVSRAQSSAPNPDDSALNVVEPDFTVINLPTTLRLPARKSAFRVTHRFGRSLTRSTFGQDAETFFGIDDGAQIGLEYRFAVMRGLQAGIYRTSDKTIEFFGQYDLFRQSASMPATVDVAATIEGRNNFHKGTAVPKADNEYAPSIGVLLSRTIGDVAAFYLQPTFVAHANARSAAGVDSNTVLVGLSTRVRIRPTAYVVASWAPRASGFRPGVALATFGIEKRLGGHMFQLNFSNSAASTMGQIARGSSNNTDWYMGFNITRKFY
jgi:hypothetical protein